MALRSAALKACRFDDPVADLCCGDGVFTFLHLGGTFDPGFDVFQGVSQLDRVRDEHVDMFDCVNEDYLPEVLTTPERKIDVGLDLKPSLIAKAQRLNLYGRLLQHDSNLPLPFDDASLQTVYCNAAYWIENMTGFLRELGRITQPDGSIILQVKLESMRRYTLNAHRGVLGDRLLELLGRGRLDCWPTLADRATWERRFAAADLTVESATPFVTRTHAHLWDIGLRPIAPMLIKMANGLSDPTRLSIKTQWVDLFCELLDPFRDPNLDLFDGMNEPAEIQYVLTRR